MGMVVDEKFWHMIPTIFCIQYLVGVYVVFYRFSFGLFSSYMVDWQGLIIVYLLNQGLVVALGEFRRNVFMLSVELEWFDIVQQDWTGVRWLLATIFWIRFLVGRYRSSWIASYRFFSWQIQVFFSQIVFVVGFFQLVRIDFLG